MQVRTHEWLWTSFVEKSLMLPVWLWRYFGCEHRCHWDGRARPALVGREGCKRGGSACFGLGENVWVLWNVDSWEVITCEKGWAWLTNPALKSKGKKRKKKKKTNRTLSVQCYTRLWFFLLLGFVKSKKIVMRFKSGGVKIETDGFISTDYFFHPRDEF